MNLWWRFFKQRKPRYMAKRVADACAQKGDTSAKGLLTVVRGMAGLDELRIQKVSLDGATLGLTERSGKSAVISIATHCATIQHTLFHELGHILLGHSHVSLDLAVSALDGIDVPPGFEHTHELLAPVQDCGAVEDAEEEAEIFAFELAALRAIPSAIGREFVYGLG